MNKTALRQKFRDARQKLPATVIAEAAFAASELLQKSASWIAARTVALHVGVRGELPTTPLLAAAWKAGKRVALPRMENGCMVMRLTNPSMPLVTGNFGIQEPPLTAAVINPDELDLVLTPGLAFDLTGGRLGQGGGDYDRLLKAVRPTCAKIGWCYDFQIIDSVPLEAHDQRVDSIATPTVYRTVIR